MCNNGWLLFVITQCFLRLELIPFKHYLEERHSSKNIHHINPTCRSFSYSRTFSNRTKLLAVPVRNQFLGLYVRVQGLRGIPQSFQASSRIAIKKGATVISDMTPCNRYKLIDVSK